MNFTGWRYYVDPMTGKNTGIISPDGKESRLLVDVEVSAWIKGGGIPLPAV